jgi:hypothetical protein
MLIRTIRFAGILAISASIAACGKSEVPAPAAAPAPAAPTEPAKAEPAEAEPAPLAQPTPAPAEPAPAPAEPAPAEVVDPADQDGPPGMAEDAMRTHADAVMTKWLAAQNSGDFDAYTSLYANDFKGVRRTATGAPKEFDLAGWKADRADMFKNKLEVAADGITITEDKTPGIIVVTFTQRWRSGKYADHGQKVIKLRAEADGVHRIIVEDMRTSTKGWEDARVKAADLTAMKSPLTMRVFVDRRVPKDWIGDCAGGRMEIEIEDAAGRKETIEAGTVTGMREEGNPGQRTPLAPSKKGRYQDLGSFCGGLEAGWRVEKDGDFIIGTDIWTDEITGFGRARWVLANLPAGTEVVLK